MAEANIITDIYQGRARCTFRPGNHTYSIRVHGHVDKLWQPSVTGILGLKAKPALTNWAAKKSLEYVSKKLGEFQSVNGEKAPVPARDVELWLAESADGWNEDSATTIGHVAHSFLYEELKHRAGSAPKPNFPLKADAVLMPNFTPAMVEAANHSALAGMSWFDEHDIRPILMERPLWLPQEGVVGTPDLIAMIDGELAIADYKTSKRIYAEYWAQLAILQAMYMNEFPGQIVKRRWAINIPKDGSDLQADSRPLDQRYFEDLDMFMACWTLYKWERANDDYKKGTPVQIFGDINAKVPLHA